MKRTVKLTTIPLNKNKQDAIRELEVTYSKLKEQFLMTLAPASMWKYLLNKRGFRDFAKDTGLYLKGVNVHLVDQAAFDAVDTWIRHIESVLVISEIKAKIYKRFSGESQHYACSILKNYRDIGAVLKKELPVREKINLIEAEKAKVCRFLHHHLREAFTKVNNPTTYLTRSFSLDNTLYRSFTVERKGQSPMRRQYVSIVGTQPNKRIVLPLSGSLVWRISSIG